MKTELSFQVSLSFCNQALNLSVFILLNMYNSQMQVFFSFSNIMILIIKSFDQVMKEIRTGAFYT